MKEPQAHGAAPGARVPDGSWPHDLGFPEHRIRENNHGSSKFYGSVKNVENRACLNLDAMSVPEALVHSIRILVAPAVVLAHPIAAAMI